MNPGLRFVLVRPRTPANIGSVARVMKNFGLSDLLLVDPRLHRHTDEPGGPPKFEAESRKTAWRAVDVLENSRRVGTLQEAVASCSLVLATAPQPFRNFPVWTPEKAAEALMTHAGDSAIVFGSESSGLDSGEIALCRAVVVIPTHEDYQDLNLAQSAALMAYLCFRADAGLRPGGEKKDDPVEPSAPTGLVAELSDLLISISDRIGFATVPNAPVLAELRNILHRHGLNRREAALMRAFFGRVDAALQALGSHARDRRAQPHRQID
ncbi:MAG: TrmH family RNA methyltransferase [Acidobacteriota bacterium]|jgi:tRNA/rRNA methyltransferase